MNRDGSNPRLLLPPRPTIAVTKPQPAGAGLGSWTPDGRFVLVQWAIDPWLRPDGVGYDLSYGLYAIRVADGLAIRLTRWRRTDGQPVFR
jgi:hypothetical protein